jgi:hypothetical protein
MMKRVGRVRKSLDSGTMAEGLTESVWITAVVVCYQLSCPACTVLNIERGEGELACRL